jgi:hypothetical protein
VVVGTASAVSNKAASNQAAKAQAAAPPAPTPDVAVAAPAPAPAPAPADPAPLTAEVVDQLKQLGELRDAGILTDDEFQAKKTQILGL